jgi:hypothetical protein
VEYHQIVQSLIIILALRPDSEKQFINFFTGVPQNLCC